ncbi:DHA1 family bicyclomycin/chloramphenicol resistance-like MFS transporter [Desulfobotulus alkaliphilus]|uniref:DHA1 family bicyclomycin/chloramphenicol resistance-like MFS transporter n=1 Tax=Desulfobotulus alkaliphilus TaxID=622671 RepID=A0A562RKF0_9BACT|nr:multidrug effflux MFS transporter [Desulfobotulus alkaliphilus]TWI68886.1 DHA1 family bicyclomycin/chloramphenicol resistance-like MFS transporter [Desulfobotulus alkaliphilus]
MKKDGFGRIIALIALLSAFPPLATDMYLPALPTLQAQWNQPLSIVNLTLVAFFVTYCFFLLVYGPLSDRFGRKPPLMAGIAIYVAASFLCAVAPSIYHLIVYRVLQASGAAAASAIALAIIKDRIPGQRREQAMAHVAIITALAPMIAPVIGGLIMIRFSWPWIFVSQGILGLVSLGGVAMMQESLQKTGVQVSFMRRYLGVVRNRRFLRVVMVISLVGLPLFAFIGGSSDIYISTLGLSESQFGFLFGANAFCFMVGSFCCSRLVRKAGGMRLMSIGFCGIFIGGAAMVFLPLPGAMQMALPMALITFCIGLSRPPSNNIALEQVDVDTGSASSILIFIYFVMGAFSMFFISLDWKNKMQVIGTLAACSGAGCFVCWQLLKPHLRMPVMEQKRKAP